MKERILVIGSGAREHALCWKIAQSPLLDKLYCTPGNPGTARVANNIALGWNDTRALIDFIKAERVSLVVIGPEQPLALGVADALCAAAVPVVGPSQRAAQLESSKAFAKEIMLAAHVPTAGAHVCRSESELRAYVSGREPPIVLKADGLAQGKGVCVCMTRGEIEEAIPHLFGAVGAGAVLVEDFLVGAEVSFIVATDGRHVEALASSHDYKRICDGDKGPNTGGMGAVSPSPRLSTSQADMVIARIVQPVLAEMERRGMPFSGFLYVGLMVSPDGTPRVIEFNARLGDPECQVLLRRMTSDIVPLLAAMGGGFGERPLPRMSWDTRACVCVVQAAKGYPGKIEVGDIIIGDDLAGSMPEIVVFHAGSTWDERGEIVTSGGRVLSVTALGDSVSDARARAYRASDVIQFRGKHIRRDIGIE